LTVYKEFGVLRISADFNRRPRNWNSDGEGEGTQHTPRTQLVLVYVLVHYQYLLSLKLGMLLRTSREMMA
jgi:hypothetical protein